MPKFQLLKGGKGGHVLLRGVQITVIPGTRRPLPVDIRVFEEDTHLVLTVDPVMCYSEEHPIRVLNNLARDRPRKPGEIVVNGASWYAVVHDLDAENNLLPEWVAGAYRELLGLALKKKIRRMGIPLLGSVHGNISPAQSLELLVREIKSFCCILTCQLFILTDKKHMDNILVSLRKLA